MLVDIQLKKVADFHGHLCPDLIIGYRACEMALELLSREGDIKGNLTVIAENTTSALDAIQYNLGCTLGNQRLRVIDFGKHKYTFVVNQSGLGVKISLKAQRFGDEELYRELEEKIIKNQATIEDIAYYQRLVDDRVGRLLALKNDDLFEAVVGRMDVPQTETHTIFLKCSSCGEPVLKSKLIHRGGSLVCRPCLHHLRKAASNAAYRFSLVS